MKSGIRKRLAAAIAVLSASSALMLSVPGTSAAAPAATPSLRAFGITGDGTLMATFTTDRPDVLN